MDGVRPARVCALENAPRTMELIKKVGGDVDKAVEVALENGKRARPDIDDMTLLSYRHAIRSTFKWTANGLPLIEPSHKLAASLMATSIPSEITAHGALETSPWSTFAVMIPSNLVRISAVGKGGDSCVFWEPDTVFVETCDDFTRLLIFSIKGSFLTWCFSELAEMGESTHDEFEEELWSMYSSGEVSDVKPVGTTAERMAVSNARAQALISRLVAGVCLELDQPKYREVIAEGRKTGEARKSKTPKAWTFKLTRDVKVDCREWVRAYVRGDSESRPYVQSLVRGHHKLQAHGPGSLLRKRIHIEPYWRGDEDAPIAVKTHRVG